MPRLSPQDRRGFFVEDFCMSSKFLDEAGLSYFWGKLKDWVSGRGYITASGSISGNAGTASALQTARTLSLTGDATGSVSFDGSADASITVKRRSTLLRNAYSDAATYPWYLAASVAGGVNVNRDITFLVENTYSSKSYGIFRIDARFAGSSAAVTTSNVFASWLVDQNFSVARSFIKLIIPDNNTSRLELWVNIGWQYGAFRFTVLSEGTHGSSEAIWELHSASRGAASPTQGTECTIDPPRLVLTVGDQTISGAKTFASPIIIDCTSTSYSLRSPNNTGYQMICGGRSNNGQYGGTLTVVGADASSNPGMFRAHAGKSGATKDLIGQPDGTFTWNGQNIQVSSDERIKTPLAVVPDDVLDAWGEVEWGQFQYLEAVAEKGGAARLHLGLIAQRVKAVFEARGLDACAYGILCHEVRPAVDEEETVVDAEAYTDEEGVEHPAATHVETRHEDAVDLWMVRYAEAQAMEAAYQRRRADRLEARLAALEFKIS